jgi:hypothetical protein
VRERPSAADAARPEAHRSEFKTSQATAIATSEFALDTHCCFRSALAAYARDYEGHNGLRSVAPTETESGAPLGRTDESAHTSRLGSNTAILPRTPLSGPYGSLRVGRAGRQELWFDPWRTTASLNRPLSAHSQALGGARTTGRVTRLPNGTSLPVSHSADEQMASNTILVAKAVRNRDFVEFVAMLRVSC